MSERVKECMISLKNAHKATKSNNYRIIFIVKDTLTINANSTISHYNVSRIFKQQLFCFVFVFDVTTPVNNMRTLRFAS